MYVLNRKSLLHTQKIHCGAGVQDFGKKDLGARRIYPNGPFHSSLFYCSKCPSSTANAFKFPAPSKK